MVTIVYYYLQLIYLIFTFCIIEILLIQPEQTCRYYPLYFILPIFAIR